MQRPHAGGREETWSDPLTGRTRYAVYERGRLTFAFGTVPTSGVARAVWVDYRARLWRSVPLRFSRETRVATVTNGAAAEAQATRDKVAGGKAVIVEKEVVVGRQTLRLRETLHLPEPKLPAIGGFPRSVHLPPPLAVHIDTWVDPLTYLTVRTRFTVRGHSSMTNETWLPRTRANVAAARIIIPDGFGHEPQRGNMLTSSFSVSAQARCAQS